MSTYTNAHQKYAQKPEVKAKKAEAEKKRRQRQEVKEKERKRNATRTKAKREWDRKNRKRKPQIPYEDLKSKLRELRSQNSTNIKLNAPRKIMEAEIERLDPEWLQKAKEAIAP